LWVNRIHGSQPKQTQAIYHPYYQSDTAKLEPFFEEYGWLRSIKDWGAWLFCRKGVAKQPKRLKVRLSKQIQGFRRKQTQTTYLLWNLVATAEIGPFFGEF
jgi:hypothetical protein